MVPFKNNSIVQLPHETVLSEIICDMGHYSGKQPEPKHFFLYIGLHFGNNNTSKETSIAA